MSVAKKVPAKIKTARTNGHRFETFAESQRETESEFARDGLTAPQRGRNFLSESEWAAGDVERSAIAVTAVQVVPTDAVLKKAPQSEKLQNESFITKLKDEIWDLWAVKTLENWFWVGKKLCQLRVERAKPGSGKFMADLAELGIPYWTAVRRINFYGSVVAGYDPSLCRRLQNAKDVSEWLVEDVLTCEQEALKKAADEKLKRRKEAIEAESQQADLDLLDKKKRAPDYLVRLYLPNLNRRKVFVQAWQKLGQKKATALVFKVIVNVANRRKRK